MPVNSKICSRKDASLSPLTASALMLEERFWTSLTPASMFKISFSKEKLRVLEDPLPAQVCESQSPYEAIRLSLGNVMATMNSLVTAMQVGEYDTKEPLPQVKYLFPFLISLLGAMLTCLSWYSRATRWRSAPKRSSQIWWIRKVLPWNWKKKIKLSSNSELRWSRNQKMCQRQRYALVSSA